jgi:hypothetical protein
MTGPHLDDSSVPGADPTPERRRTTGPGMAPPGRRGAALFPDQSGHRGGPPPRIRRLLREAISEPRNRVPLALIILLAIVAAGLFVRPAKPSADQPGTEWFARLVLSSSRPGTSIFANGRYLGEIGPEGREFNLSPGHFALRFIRRDCQAGDTVIDLQAGDRITVGPLNPACGRR